MLERPQLAELLDLAPHPEGGWFRETWRAPVRVLPDGYPGIRNTATGIYFLLMPGEQSRWHLVRSDELWFWHSGGPLTLRFGGADDVPGEVTEAVLGPDVAAGQQPQLRVPGGVWQAAMPHEQQVLVSCVVSPGFDFDDFILMP